LRRPAAASWWTGAAFAVFGMPHHPQIRRWSEVIAQSPQRTKSDEIIVGKGETLILDTPGLPRLRRLVVNGTLIVEDKTDLQLEVGEVLVTGRLQIGTRENPFRHKAVITLTGDRAAPRMISVTGGALELHGADRGISWTRLAENAAIGATEITLDKAPGWLPGSTIVLASTDFDAHQAETRQVTEVTWR
jgi:cell migration-inducing and hyaluronan-binding protein